jgi:hypothetical protein
LFLFILNAILNNSWILSIAEMQLKIETSCVPVLYDVDPSLHTEKFKHEPGKVYLWKNISLDLMQEISKIHSSLSFLYIFLKNMWCFIVLNYHIIKFYTIHSLLCFIKMYYMITTFSACSFLIHNFYMIFMFLWDILMHCCHLQGVNNSH